MTAKRVGGMVALTLALAAGGCLGAPRPVAAPSPPPSPPAPSVVAPPAIRPVTYPVGLRVLPLRRGARRPLPTLVFYPAALPRLLFPAHQAVIDTRPAHRVDRRIMQRLRKHDTLAYGTLGAPPAFGRFPVVVFSHGLSGSPDWCAAVLAAWASAGFVVAAPTFPHTSEFTRDYRRSDIVNQPADVRYALARVRRLDSTPGDPLHGRIDGDRVAAVGHSAGGYTTSGLFTAGHDPRLRAGVIMAGWAAPDAFAGSPATMLFLQGNADPVVPAAVSRAAYRRVPWAKSYLLMRHLSHANYLRRHDRGFRRVTNVVTAFLRWTLNGDDAVRGQLPPIA